MVVIFAAIMVVIVAAIMTVTCRLVAAWGSARRAG